MTIPMQERIDSDEPEPGLSGITISSPSGKIQPNELPEFDNFAAAFDYCRETDHPVRVLVNGARWKLYPSGKATTETPGAHHLTCGCLKYTYGSEALRILGVR